MCMLLKTLGLNLGWARIVELKRLPSWHLFVPSQLLETLEQCVEYV